MDNVEIRHFHLFAGLGGGARGFNRGHARLGSKVAKFRCIGGVDVDPGAVRDFGRLAGVPGTVLDMFSREQYEVFHGKPPPAGWREATPEDIRRAAGGERPHIWFTSPPCKGLSGLLSEKLSQSGRYQALNQLTVRGIWLGLEAWKDDPAEFILLENVPRIANRGRPLLDQIVGLLRAYGYAVAETTHDCGELGGLAQSRKRFLLVARHAEKVPPFLYEPVKRPLRAVGDVLSKLPLPGNSSAGPMHRLPALQWKTWVRLAFVEAGSDWRSLDRLKIKDGVLEDFALVPEWAMHNGVLGISKWNEPAGVVAGSSLPTNGRFSVADPRVAQSANYAQLGVRNWNEPTGTVSGQSTVGGGTHAIADPRLQRKNGDPRFSNVYRVVRWSDVGQAVTGGTGPSAGGVSIADPRVGYGAGSHRNKLVVVDWKDRARTVTGANQVQGGALSVADPRGMGKSTHHHSFRVTDWKENSGTITGSRSPGGGALCVADPRPEKHEQWSGGKYRVTGFDEPTGAVIAASGTGNGAFAVADPRPKGKGANYQTAGNYGVVPWDASAYAVSASACHDNGHNSVADPRLCTYCTPEGCGFPECDMGRRPLPGASERLVAVIRAMDDTWHRPFTTLELAALQGLVDPEEHLELEGLSDSAWRERIGNAVPSPAAEAIAGVMGRALLGAWAGESFTLSSAPIWVRPVAIAIATNIPT